MDESKIIDLQSKLDGKFKDLIRIILSKERRDKKFKKDYAKSIFEIVEEMDSEGAYPLESFEMLRRRADEAAILSYKPESVLNKMVRAKQPAKKETTGCKHKNKAEEDFMIIC